MSADENRLRRLRRSAERNGFILQKSRRRDPNASDYGKYRVLCTWTNTGYEWDLQKPYALTFEEAEEEILPFHCVRCGRRAGLNEDVSDWLDHVDGGDLCDHCLTVEDRPPPFRYSTQFSEALKDAERRRQGVDQ